MTPEELESRLAQGEGVSQEFKRCGALPEADVYETVCSFANRQGGSVFLGVDDDGNVLGVNPKLVRDIERNLANVTCNPNAFTPAPAIETERIDVGAESWCACGSRRARRCTDTRAWRTTGVRTWTCGCATTRKSR